MKITIKKGGNYSMTTGPYNETEKRFVENNLQLTNRELSLKLGRSKSSVKCFLDRQRFRRNKEQISQIRSRLASNQIGENNPNWRGGISKDNYHYKKLQIERYPKRIKARETVRQAIRSGTIVRGECSVCGIDEKIEAHHPDYSSPLTVEWLCRKHHRELHNIENKTIMINF